MTPETEIPEGMLALGAPAKVRGPLAGTPAERWVRANPEGYQALAQRHKPGTSTLQPRSLLDFGAYDALRRIAAMAIDPGVTHRVIGTDPEIVDESGLSLKPDSVYEDLSKFDLLYVSGDSARSR